MIFASDNTTKSATRLHAKARWRKQNKILEYYYSNKFIPAILVSSTYQTNSFILLQNPEQEVSWNLHQQFASSITHYSLCLAHIMTTTMWIYLSQ
jgi:hypothetical protein